MWISTSCLNSMWYLQNPFPSCREGKSLISCPVPNAFSCKRYFPQKNRIVKTSTDKEPPKLYLAAPQWQHRLPLDDRIALCRDHSRATITLRARTLHHVCEVHPVRRQTGGKGPRRSGVTEAMIALPRS